MTDALALWVGERLLIGSIQVAVLVAMVWLTCHWVPRVPAAAQAALWWLVALKLVLVFAPVPALPIPVLPEDFERQTERIFLRGLAPGAEEETVRRVWVTDSFTVQGTDAGVVSAINPWFQALILLWLVALVVQAGRLVLAHRHLRGVVRRSIEWTDAETSMLANRLGLKRTPRVRLSDEIGSPQVFGLWSPVVLIPTETIATLSAEERTMTLCHELMHVRRRDLFFGWVPACAERLFFFHPLARVAAREYLTAREAACDAAAVRALGVAADDYGRMLIRLGIGNVRPALAAGGSPFSKSSLKRRLHMLEHQQPSTSARRWWWVIALIGAAVIPLQLVARSPEAPPVSKPDLGLYHLLVPPPAQAQAKKVVIAEDPEMYLIDVETGKGKKLKIVDDQQDTEFYISDVKSGKVKKLTIVDDDQQSVILEGDIRFEWEKLKHLVDDQSEVKIRAQKDDVTQRVDEFQVEFEKLKQALEEARLTKKVEQNRTSPDKLTMIQLLEAKLREQRDGKKVAIRDQAELAQGLQRLAERLERLAVEQQQLAEELRRLQSPGR